MEEFEFVCSYCHSLLTYNINYKNEIEIDPCPECAEDNRMEGYSSGFTDGCGELAE